MFEKPGRIDGKQGIIRMFIFPIAKSPMPRHNEPYLSSHTMPCGKSGQECPPGNALETAQRTRNLLCQPQRRTGESLRKQHNKYTLENNRTSKYNPLNQAQKKGQVWRELLLRCKIKQHAILLHSNHQIEDIDPRMLQKHHVFKVMLKGNHIFETDSHDVSHVQGDLRQILGTSFPVSNLKIYILSTHTHPPLKKHTRTACPNQKKKNAAYSRFGHLRGAIG